MPVRNGLNSIRLHFAAKLLPPFRASQNLSHNPRNVFNDFRALADHLWTRSCYDWDQEADSVSVHPRAASIWTSVECPGGKSFFDNLNSAQRQPVRFCVTSRGARMRSITRNLPSHQDWVRFVKRLNPQPRSISETGDLRHLARRCTRSVTRNLLIPPGLGSFRKKARTKQGAP
jgi:hypothetical protein